MSKYRQFSKRQRIKIAFSMQEMFHKKIRDTIINK